MTTVDITLGTSLNKGDEFGELPVFKTTVIYSHAFTELYGLNNYSGIDAVFGKAVIECRKEISSDVDKLRDQVRTELNKVKKLSKKMFPVRHRLEVARLFVKYPRAFIYGLIKK